jgi:hypothetical protein
MEEWVRKLVRAKAYFLSPEEGGHSGDVDLRDPHRRCEMLADFGLGRTEDGRQRYCAAVIVLEGDPGYIKLGVEQTVLVGLYCPDAVVRPTIRFDLSEGPKVVARATVLSVLETTCLLSIFIAAALPNAFIHHCV